MNGKSTRWLSLLLCLVMILSLLPVTAFAETEETETATSAEPVTEETPVVLATDSTVDYYGRNALSALPNATALLYAYDQLAAGVATSAASITVYNGTDPLTLAELQTAMDAYRRDYTYHFWLDNGYSYYSNSTTVTRILPTYLLSGTELETARAAFDAKAEDLLSGITASMSEYEKALYLHDALAGVVTYQAGTYAHTAYGALVEGAAVCDGYAEALQYLLQNAGIQSFIAIGDSNVPSSGTLVGHAWNYVRIDGAYYHTDLTWDDQEETIYHTYFNQTDAIILEDHLIDTTAYALPTCTSTAAQYFTGRDTYLSTYTTDLVGQLLKDNGMTVHVYIPGSVDDFLSWYKANAGTIGRTAGITGSFSYGYSHLGRELVLRLRVTCSHTSLTLQPGAEPTPLAPGYKSYYRCSCGQFFEDAEAAVAITDFIAWKEGPGKIVYTVLFSGSCGESMTWSFADGILTLSGSGVMENYTTASPAPWYPHRQSIQTLEIASGVTQLGTAAFASCQALVDVYYAGAATQLSICEENDPLENATWHYLTIPAHDNLQDAINAATESGTVVLMTQDIAARSITVHSETVLDLNGHTLEVNYFTCYGNVTDGTTGGNGLLKAAKGIHIAGTESFLPIYDSADGGYRFYQYQLQNLGFKTIPGNANACKAGLRLTLANPAGYTVLAGTTDDTLAAIQYIWWEGSLGAIEYTFSNQTLCSYATQVASDMATSGTSSKAMILTIGGLDRLGESSTVSVQPALETTPGVNAQGDACTWLIP